MPRTLVATCAAQLRRLAQDVAPHVCRTPRISCEAPKHAGTLGADCLSMAPTLTKPRFPSPGASSASSACSTASIQPDPQCLALTLLPGRGQPLHPTPNDGRPSTSSTGPRSNSRLALPGARPQAVIREPSTVLADRVRSATVADARCHVESWLPARHNSGGSPRTSPLTSVEHRG